MSARAFVTGALLALAVGSGGGALAPGAAAVARVSDEPKPSAAADSPAADPKPTQHEFIIKNFKTESGVVLPQARVVYGTYGKLDATGDNAVLLPSHYMADMRGYGWLIGKGKALDSDKLFLVTSELFGNGRSSSPSNTPEPYHGPRFPVTTIRDNVEAVHRLLTEQLHIKHLKAVIGFSMGAQQAFQWAVSYPDYMDRIVATSGTAKTYGHGIVRLESEIAAIAADPTFAGGDYKVEPKQGLDAFGLVWTAWLFSQEWWRKELWRTIEPPGTTFEQVLDHYRTNFIPGADANDVILQMRTWERHDVGGTPPFHGDVEAALRSIRVPVLYMPSQTDLYFPVEDARYEAQFIPHVQLAVIPSLWGHPAGAGASPADLKFLNERIAAFMAGGTAGGATAAASGGAVADGTTGGGARLVHRYLSVALAPDAAHVAVVEGDSPAGGYYPDVRDLVIRRVADGRAVRIDLPCGRVPQCWPSSPAWSRDGKTLSFALRTPGSHAYAVYSVAADGSGLTRALAFNGTLTDLKYGPDGTLALLAVADAKKEVGATEAGAPVAGDLDAPPTEQRIATLKGGALTWASPPDLFVYQYDWRPGGAGFVGTAAAGDGDANWWTAKLYAFAPSGAARVLYAPPSRQEQLADPTVSPDGKRVAFIGGLMSDFGSTGGDVFTVALDGPGRDAAAGAPATALDVTPEMKASATSLAWSCHGELRAALLAGDETQIVALGDGVSPASPRVLEHTTDTLHGEAAAASWACPSDTLATVRESFTLPPQLEVGRIGQRRVLAQDNAGLSARLSARSIRWRNEGFDVQGWLLLPAHVEGRIPMITVVHGGPAAASRPRFAGPGLTERMLARGWAVFYPNPRGSFGQGARFTAANVRDFGYGDLRDILAGIDAAERMAPIDDARLGLTGGSYGGFMSMFAVTQTPRFKAAVAAAGLSNWQSYYGENGIDEWMIPYFGASVYEDPAVYARSSAINFIKHAHTPTFAYVGERDIECPAPQTEEFWRALKAQGVPASIMIYPGEGHGLRDPQHAADATERTLAWFDKYLH